MAENLWVPFPLALGGVSGLDFIRLDGVKTQHWRSWMRNTALRSLQTGISAELSSADCGQTHSQPQRVYPKTSRECFRWEDPSRWKAGVLLASCLSPRLFQMSTLLFLTPKRSKTSAPSFLQHTEPALGIGAARKCPRRAPRVCMYRTAWAPVFLEGREKQKLCVISAPFARTGGRETLAILPYKGDEQAVTQPGGEDA